VETVSTPASEAPAAEAPAAPRFQGIDPAEYKTQRAAIVAEKAKGLKDLMEGVIEPDAYSALVDAADEKLEALAVARTLHEANAQTEAQTQAQVLDKIMRAAKADGIDYAANGKAARRFDAEMALMDADGDKRPYAERAADAHKTVATLLGKPKAKADAESAQGARQAPRERQRPRDAAQRAGRRGAQQRRQLGGRAGQAERPGLRGRLCQADTGTEGPTPERLRQRWPKDRFRPGST